MYTDYDLGELSFVFDVWCCEFVNKIYQRIQSSLFWRLKSNEEEVSVFANGFLISALNTECTDASSS